jgi:hypothetical protein
MAKEEVAELVASLKRPEGVKPSRSSMPAKASKPPRDRRSREGRRDAHGGARAEERRAKEELRRSARSRRHDEAEGRARAGELEAENERLTKALGDAAPAVEDLTKRFTDVLEAQSLRKRFEDEPLPAKTAGTTRVVAKAQDSAGGAKPSSLAAKRSRRADREGLGALSEEEKGMLLKGALANPGMIRLPLSPQAA